MPAVRVFHNAAQSITSATPTNLAFNSERIDQASNAADTMHDTVTNNSRLTCRYAGVYIIIANIEWAASTAGTRILTIRLNATTNIGSTQVQSPTSAIFQQVTPTMWPLAVNDFVTAEVTQNSGGALNVNATGNISPEFMMARLA